MSVRFWPVSAGRGRQKSAKSSDEPYTELGENQYLEASSAQFSGRCTASLIARPVVHLRILLRTCP